MAIKKYQEDVAKVLRGPRAGPRCIRKLWRIPYWNRLYGTRRLNQRAVGALQAVAPTSETENRSVECAASPGYQRHLDSTYRWPWQDLPRHYGKHKTMSSLYYH